MAVLAGRLALLTAIALIAAAAGLAYRIWAQATASLPESPPGVWVYDLAGRLAAPFERFETAPAAHEAPAVHLPAIIALDVYVAVACGLLFLVWLTRSIVSFRRRPMTPRAPVTPLPLRLGRALAGNSRNAAIALREAVPAAAAFAGATGRSLFAGAQAGVAYLVATIRGIDWEGHRARANAGIERLRSFRISESAKARQAASHGTVLLQEARRGLTFATATWRTELASGPRSVTWLSERAIASARAGQSSLAAHRARHARRRYIPGARARRMSRRSFLRLPAPRP